LQRKYRLLRVRKVTT